MKQHFFFDHCLSRRVARALNELGGRGWDAHALVDVFPDSSDDIVWIPEVSRRGWSLITSDKLRRPGEPEALQQAQLTTFFVHRNSLSGLKLTIELLRIWPNILDCNSSASPGDHFDVQLGRRRRVTRRP